MTTAFPPLALRPSYSPSTPSQEIGGLAFWNTEGGKEGGREDWASGIDFFTPFYWPNFSTTTNDNETTPTLPAPPHPASTIVVPQKSGVNSLFILRPFHPFLLTLPNAFSKASRGIS